MRLKPVLAAPLFAPWNCWGSIIWIFISFHQPVGDVFGAWRTIEALYREDLLRAVGVSNFSPDRLMDMALSSTIRPQVNQVEINPFCQQKDALPVMASLGILPEAWAPFAEGRNGLFSNAVLAGIAAKHNASIAQIVLA